jgi:hypothetical protein
MTMSKIFKPVVLLLMALLVALPAGLVSAADDEPKPLHPGISNGLSDTTNSSFSKISLQPGEHFSGTFKFFNLGSQSFKVNLSVTPYSVKDESYERDQTSQTDRTQISRWMSFPRNDFVLAAGETADIEYVVDVPKDVPDGGQYAIIVASADLLTKRDSWVNTVALGYTIYATINEGNTRIDARLINQEIPKFYLKGPIGDAATIKNSGNTDVQAKHKIVVSDFFSNRELYDSGEVDNFILPDTSRKMVLEWDNTSELGIYKIKSSVTMLGQTYEEDGVVLVLPIYVIIIFGAVILLLIWAIVLKIRQRRKKTTKEGSN